jgi:MOSC domain-containing protein YiiM
VITEGVDLNALEGRIFTIGRVQLRGVELCEPCAYLQNLLDIPGLVKQLTHKGGLRCEILGGGVIRPGDEIGTTD